MTQDPGTIRDDSELRNLTKLQLRDDYRAAARKYVDGTDTNEWYEIIHDFDFGTSTHELLIYAHLVCGSSVNALNVFWDHAITPSRIDDEMERRDAIVTGRDL